MPNLIPEMYKPVHFSNNSHNENQAIRSRVTMDLIPPEKGKWNKVKIWTMKYKKYIFPGIEKVKSLDFETWISRVGSRPSVIRMYHEAWESLKQLGITQFTKLDLQQLKTYTKRSCFIKVENLLYRTKEGLLKKAPRMISGASPYFVVLVGPWIMALQDALKESWNEDHFITTACGKSGEDIGRWAWKHRLRRYYIEDDISKFDSSCQRDCLKFEHQLYQSFGAPVAVNQLIYANIRTNAKTRFGIRYYTPDGRKSGDPYTSLGNGIINAIMHLYEYAQSVEDDWVAIRDNSLK